MVKPARAEPAVKPATDGLVRCRWVAPDPVAVKDPTPRRVHYGDECWLTAEQANDPRTPAIRWDDDWTPDPELEMLAAGYNQED